MIFFNSNKNHQLFIIIYIKKSILYVSLQNFFIRCMASEKDQYNREFLRTCLKHECLRLIIVLWQLDVLNCMHSLIFKGKFTLWHQWGDKSGTHTTTGFVRIFYLTVIIIAVYPEATGRAIAPSGNMNKGTVSEVWYQTHAI